MKVKHSLEVFWSKDDDEYVARVKQPGLFASLSWLDKDPVEALRGLVKLVEDYESDL